MEVKRKPIKKNRRAKKVYIHIKTRLRVCSVYVDLYSVRIF